MAQIQLQRMALAVNEINNQHVWPLKITASLTAGATMPSPKIFVYHASMGDDAYMGDIFECVASLQQYFDLPINTPVSIEDGLVVPYYRTEVINFNCRSPAEADELWVEIQADVTDLVNNYAAFLTARESETVEI